jgi:hypothetical protein
MYLLSITSRNRALINRNGQSGRSRISSLHFALDIRNMPSPLFTGLPAMMQNLPLYETLLARLPMLGTGGYCGGQSYTTGESGDH